MPAYPANTRATAFPGENADGQLPLPPSDDCLAERTHLRTLTVRGTFRHDPLVPLRRIGQSPSLWRAWPHGPGTAEFAVEITCSSATNASCRLRTATRDATGSRTASSSLAQAGNCVRISTPPSATYLTMNLVRRLCLVACGQDTLRRNPLVVEGWAQNWVAGATVLRS